MPLRGDFGSKWDFQEVCLGAGVGLAGGGRVYFVVFQTGSQPPREGRPIQMHIIRRFLTSLAAQGCSWFD